MGDASPTTANLSDHRSQFGYISLHPKQDFSESTFLTLIAGVGLNYFLLEGHVAIPNIF